jgi:threonine aldolase
MYNFNNDYSEGAHPKILEALIESNFEQVPGYGEDRFTKEAIALIKEQIGKEEAHIHLISGGTQTNLTTIGAFLKPYEAAIAVSSGHIATHETGAIEATGHKVLTIESEDGKLSPSLIADILNSHTDEHMVKPKLVYISNSTEIGTFYTKVELESLSNYCKEQNLLLFLDGARLGSALMAKENDLTLRDIASLVDVFYIGGTKNGALIGEALILLKEELKQDFRYAMKQRGALLAKGRVLGIQFRELFKDKLFFELAGHANQMASTLQEGINALGFSFKVSSSTNQIFPVFSDKLVDALRKEYDFLTWERVDDSHQVVRLVTSWATKEEAVNQFLKDLRSLKEE